MPAQTALQAIRSADSRAALPASIVIFGAQAFLREYVLGKISARLIDGGFQYRSFQIASNADFDRALDEFAAPDLFAKKRVVVCRVLKSRRGAQTDGRAETDDGADDEAGTVSAVGESALAHTIESYPGPNHLVALYDRDAAPAKIRRAAEKSALVIGCARPYDNQIPEYTDALARALGLRLAPGVSEYLAEKYAGDLASISNALSKAAIIAESGGALSESEFGDPGAQRMPDVFEIADNIARGRVAAALAQIDRASALGRDSFEILAVEIVPVLRRMMIAASMLSRRRQSGEIAAALGLSPYSSMAARAIEGARRYGADRLTRAYQSVVVLDEGMKNGAIKNRENAIGAVLMSLMDS